MKRELTRDEMLTRAVVFTAVTGTVLALPHAGEAAQNFNTENYASQIIVDQTDGQEWYTKSGETKTKTYASRTGRNIDADADSSTTHSNRMNIVSITDTGVTGQVVSYTVYPEAWQVKNDTSTHSTTSTLDWYNGVTAATGNKIVSHNTAATTTEAFKNATIGSASTIATSSSTDSTKTGAEVRAVDQGTALIVVAEGLTSSASPNLTLTTGNTRQKNFDSSGNLVATTSSSTSNGYYGTKEGGTINVVVQPSSTDASHKQLDYTSAYLYDSDAARTLRAELPSYSDVSTDLSNIYFQAVGGDINFVNGSVTVKAENLYGSLGAAVTHPDSSITISSPAANFNGTINIGSIAKTDSNSKTVYGPNARVVLSGNTAFNAYDGTNDNSWVDYAGNTIKNAKDFIVLNPNGTLAGAQAQFFSVTSDIATGIRTDASNAINFNGGTVELTDSTLTDTQLERAQDAVNNADSLAQFKAWRNAISAGGALTTSTPAPSVVRASSSTTVSQDTSASAPTATFNNTSTWSNSTYAGAMTVPAGSLVTDAVNVGGHADASNQFNLIDYHTYATHYTSTTADNWLESSDPSVSGTDTDGNRKTIHASRLNFATAPTRILIGDERHLTLSDGFSNELIQVDGAAPTSTVDLTVEGNSVLTLGGTINSDNTLRANIVLNGGTTRTDVATGSDSAVSTAGAVLELVNGTKTVNGITLKGGAIILHDGGNLTVDDLSTTASTTADGTITATDGRITIQDGGVLTAGTLSLTNTDVDVMSATGDVSGISASTKITGSNFIINYADAALDALGNRLATNLQNIQVTGASTLKVGKSDSKDAGGDLHLAAGSVLTSSTVLLDATWTADSLTTLPYNDFDAGTYTAPFDHAAMFSDTLSGRTSADTTAPADIADNDLDYTLTVGQQGLASLGSSLASTSSTTTETSVMRNAESMKTFRESRLDWGTSDRHDKNVTAALYLENPIQLTYAASTSVGTDTDYDSSNVHRTLVGGLTVDGSATSASATAGNIVFGTDSLLMINAANLDGSKAVLSSEDGYIDNTNTGGTLTNQAKISVAENARLYITNITTNGVGKDNGQEIDLIENLSVEEDKGWLDPDNADHIYTYPLFGVVLDKVVHDAGSEGDRHRIIAYRKSLRDVLPDSIIPNGVDGIPDSEINKDGSDYAGVRLVRKVFDNIVSGRNLLNTTIPLTNAQATEILNLAGNAAESTGATANAVRQSTILSEQANERFSALSNYAFSPSDLRTTPAGPASAFEDPKKDVDIWVKFAHQQGTTEDSGAAGTNADYDTKFNTITLGFDLPQNRADFRHGVALSYGTGKGEQASLKDDMKIKGLSYYAALANKNNNVLFDLGYYETNHDVSGDLPYIGDHLKAESKTKVITLGVTNEFVEKGKENAFVPHVGIRYSHVSTPSYTGYVNGGAAFRYRPEDQNIITLPIGVGYKKSFQKDDTTHHFLADFSYIPVLSGRDSTMETRLIGGGIDTFDNDIVSRNTFRAKLSYLAENRNASYGLDYTYRGSSDSRSHYIGAQFNFKF